MSIDDYNTRYADWQLLGRGTFSAVYRAFDQKEQKHVAIKTTPRGPQITKYVESEILNQRTLLHAHVIKFIEVFVTHYDLCMVLEYAAGGNLREYTNYHGTLQETIARRFFQQIVLAVDYCHKRKTCIRDLKLENLVLDETQSVVKLCDFGLSKHAISHSMPHSCVGTPHYVAPEVLHSDNKANYDGFKVDVWSLGVCLFVMIYGYFPFDTPNPDQVARQGIVLQKIREGRISIPTNQTIKTSGGVQLQGLSTECLDLLYRLFDINPRRRISVEEITCHPWYQTGLPPEAMRMNIGVNEVDERIISGASGMQKRAEIKRLIGIAMQTS